MSGNRFTVGELKEWIEACELPDDAEILYERIEDVYFDKHGWGKTSVKKPDTITNRKVSYPVPDDEFVYVFSPVKYPDDDNLYLSAHY